MFAVVEFVADGLLCWDAVCVQIHRNGAGALVVVAHTAETGAATCSTSSTIGSIVAGSL